MPRENDEDGLGKEGGISEEHSKYRQHRPVQIRLQPRPAEIVNAAHVVL